MAERISSSMVIFILLLLILFFVTIQFLPVTSNQPDANYQKEMDYYSFVQHWPGTMDDSTVGIDQPSTSTAGSAGGTKKKSSSSIFSFLPLDYLKWFSTKNKIQTPGKNTKAAAGNHKNKKKNNEEKSTPTLRPGHIEDFGIHGLWPQHSENKNWKDDPINKKLYPEYCPKKKTDFDEPQTSVKAVVQGAKAEDEEEVYERYDQKLIEEDENFYLELKKHWHSLASPYVDGRTVISTNKFGQKSTKSKVRPGIWENEWEKHGTCSLFEQRLYFERTLELKKQHNLLEILVEAEIIPDGESSYDLEEIRNALKKNLSNNKDVRIECNGKNELYQVHLCLTKHGMEVMDCPGNTVLCKHPEEIKFPKFPELQKDDFKDL